MADDDPDIEVITSPRKVANIRRLSSIRANFRRYSDILSHTTRKKSKSEPSAKKATKRRAQATPTGRVTLRRLPGQQQALLAFGKHSQASTSKLPATSAGASGSATKLALTSVGPSTSAGKREGLPHSYSDSSGSEDIPLPVPRKPSDAKLPGVRIPHFVGKQKAASLGLGDSDDDTVPTGAQKAVTQDRLQRLVHILFAFLLFTLTFHAVKRAPKAVLLFSVLSRRINLSLSLQGLSTFHSPTYSSR